MRKHNAFIDVLRFFAAFMVVMYHQNEPLPHLVNWYRILVKQGNIGVPAFFTISGYCIIMSAGRSKTVADFLGRRLFRIFPPYWFSILIVLLAACFQHFYTGENSIQNIPKDPDHILATIFLYTYPLTNLPTINWVYWTLTCELFFYLLVGLTLFDRKFTGAGLMLISLLAVILPGRPVGILFLLSRWPAFGLGSGLYYLTKRDNNRAGKLLGLALVLINVLGLVYQSGWTPYTIASLVTFGLIYCSAYIYMKPNFFSKLGEYSYSAYLIHVPIGIFVLGRIETDYIMQHPVFNLIYDLFIYAIISVCSWLMFKWVELPAIELGKKFTSKYFVGRARYDTAAH